MSLRQNYQYFQIVFFQSIWFELLVFRRTFFFFLLLLFISKSWTKIQNSSSITRFVITVGTNEWATAILWLCSFLRDYFYHLLQWLLQITCLFNVLWCCYYCHFFISLHFSFFIAFFIWFLSAAAFLFDIKIVQWELISSSRYLNNSRFFNFILYLSLFRFLSVKNKFILQNELQFVFNNCVNRQKIWWNRM